MGHCLCVRVSRDYTLSAERKHDSNPIDYFLSISIDFGKRSPCLVGGVAADQPGVHLRCLGGFGRRHNTNQAGD